MRKGLSECPGQECTEAERFGGDMVWGQQRGTGPPSHSVDAREGAARGSVGSCSEIARGCHQGKKVKDGLREVLLAEH